MRTALLYSGGKDSSLAAIILRDLGFEVTLFTATFGINGAWKHARTSAGVLGFSHEKLILDEALLEDACEHLKKGELPRKAIDPIHLAALEALAPEHPVIADGTRREDRSPSVSRDAIRSMEDRFDTEYVAPLKGMGYKTLNRMAQEMFVIEEGQTDTIDKGDYEVELWEYIRQQGMDPKDHFPARHIQSRVLGYKNPTKTL